MQSRYLIFITVFFVNAAGFDPHRPMPINPPITCHEHVGCFSNLPPWTTLNRPAPPPQSPEQVSHQVVMYTPDINYQEVRIYPNISPLMDLLFDPNLPTFFICHGYVNTGFDLWEEHMAQAILSKKKANILIIDWGLGAINEYYQAVSNTRTVGRQLVGVVNHLISLGANTSNFHLIGHSLGAHVLSYLCKDLKNHRIGWLTGLEVARVGFLPGPKETHFDLNDADFTDAIHTNGGEDGVFQSIAQVNFYINGGATQVGCLAPPPDTPPLALLVNAVEPIETCSHVLAFDYYSSAIMNPDCFIGKQLTESYKTKLIFNSEDAGVIYEALGILADCSKVRCIPMGLDTINFPYPGDYAIETVPLKPYCLRGVSRSAMSNGSFGLKYIHNSLGILRYIAVVLLLPKSVKYDYFNKIFYYIFNMFALIYRPPMTD